ncbi:hypothetical protein [Streptomyces sp. NPDC018031]|uniref:hypothetical protein n=1 Tax=Streptomyces sp. NPDC018031 TaxID=3365033 RepID=UPI0037A5098E
MRRFWARTRLRNTALGVLVAVVAGGGWLTLRDGGGSGGSGHLAENRSQVQRACKGALPARELSGLVPGDSPGRVREYGTMLDPGRQSRSLLDCTLDWGDGRRIAVHAEALLSEVPQKLRADELAGLGGPHLYAAPGITGQYGPHGGWLVTECLGGLRGRARETTDLYVTATVAPGTDRGWDRSALTTLRTAVHVANTITREQGCGGDPLPRPESIVAVSDDDGRGRSQRSCDWIGVAGSLPVAEGAWTTVGDQQDSPVLNACESHWTEGEDPGRPERWEVSGVSAASWSGALGRSAYDEYEGSGAVPGWDLPAGGERPGSSGDEEIDGAASDPRLALWARSVCDGGPTYHRVSVSPEIGVVGRVVLKRADRERLSQTARTVLDRYLAAEHGWPRTAHCRDTTLLGEVEEWH